MRSSDEITEQINRLNLLKKSLPPISKMGTPNHEIIDKQIEILEGDIEDEDGIYALEEELGMENLTSLFDALNWLQGEDIELVSEDDLRGEYKATSKLFDIEKIAKSIGIPTNKWEGNCHGIASLIVKKKLIDGKVERGYWNGYVDSKSIFYGKPLIPHSWIRMPDGKIADPTRFCFEQASPYIFVGNHAFYDAGGNQLREENMIPCPDFTKDDKDAKLKLPTSCKKFVMDLTGNPPFITVKQVFWLANLPLTRLNPHAKEIFKAIEASGDGASIPLDNYNIVMK